MGSTGLQLRRRNRWQLDRAAIAAGVASGADDTIRYGTVNVYAFSRRGWGGRQRVGRGRQIGSRSSGWKMQESGMNGVVVGGGRSKVKTGRGSSRLVGLMGNAKAFVRQAARSHEKKEKGRWRGREGRERAERRSGPGSGPAGLVPRSG